MEMQRNKKAKTFLKKKLDYGFCGCYCFIWLLFPWAYPNVYIFVFPYFVLPFWLSIWVHFFSSWIIFFNVTNKCLSGKVYQASSLILGWLWFLPAFGRYYLMSSCFYCWFWEASSQPNCHSLKVICLSSFNVSLSWCSIKYKVHFLYPAWDTLNLLNLTIHVFHHFGRTSQPWSIVSPPFSPVSLMKPRRDLFNLPSMSLSLPFLSSSFFFLC